MKPGLQNRVTIPRCKMADRRKDSEPQGQGLAPAENDPEQVKVVDRQGRVKYVPRSEYEQKKRRRRRRSGKEPPVRELLSLAFIVIVIIAASYIALKLIK